MTNIIRKSQGELFPLKAYHKKAAYHKKVHFEKEANNLECIEVHCLNTSQQILASNILKSSSTLCNNSKFSDGQVWANNVDPVQAAAE